MILSQLVKDTTVFAQNYDNNFIFFS